MRGGDESKPESWDAIQDWFLDLRRRGVTILFTHHEGKQLTQRGTSKREDIPDVILRLSHPPDYSAEMGLVAKVEFVKGRSLYGADAAPFMATMKRVAA